jgi:hypothetical protein
MKLGGDEVIVKFLAVNLEFYGGARQLILSIM